MLCFGFPLMLFSPFSCLGIAFACSALGFLVIFFSPFICVECCNPFLGFEQASPSDAKMASRGSGSWALVEHGHYSRASRVYSFQILLPNGTSTGLTLKDPGEEMPLHDFLYHIRTELEDAPMDGGERRGIEWNGDVYLEDLLDRKIDKKLKFSDFVTNSTNILRLQVGTQCIRFCFM